MGETKESVKRFLTIQRDDYYDDDNNNNNIVKISRHDFLKQSYLVAIPPRFESPSSAPTLIANVSNGGPPFARVYIYIYIYSFQFREI